MPRGSRVIGKRVEVRLFNDSIKTGLSFGLTSGVITTLGLITGLSSGTRSTSVVIGGILTIAIADSLSDALGIHISEESEAKHKPIEIWQATLATFISKFLFALVFIVPVLLLELTQAVIVSWIIGLVVIALLSYSLAKREKANPYVVIAEHVIITLVVIFATHYVGVWISSRFG